MKNTYYLSALLSLALVKNVTAQDTNVSNLTITGTKIEFQGASLDFYTPVQGQWNGNKPIISMSQYGEINFNSSPYFNYNTIYLKGTSDYNNGIRHGNTFGTVTGFEGPIVFGQNGGALGSSISNSNWNATGTKVALSWTANQDIKIHKRIVFPDGSVLTSAGISAQPVSFNQTSGYYVYQGNVNISGRLKIGTNSLIIDGSGGSSGTANSIYTNLTSEDLLIQSNLNNGRNTVINQLAGKVLIGSATASTQHNYKVEVNGIMRVSDRIDTKDVCITPNGFCDYVFDKNYKLKSLEDVEAFIENNHHLPEAPSEASVVKNGLKLNEIILLQMKKIEELTLYTIDLNKRIKELEKTK
ncbi:MAG: hypothetical protein EAZ53_05295 [Bacteroidetes bacterium]|nr:MAG: hypothetical protein EAZ53_05295 [Bacteroidota bacterium]